MYTVAIWSKWLYTRGRLVIIAAPCTRQKCVEIRGGGALNDITLSAPSGHRPNQNKPVSRQNDNSTWPDINIYHTRSVFVFKTTGKKPILLWHFCWALIKKKVPISTSWWKLIIVPAVLGCEVCCYFLLILQVKTNNFFP